MSNEQVIKNFLLGKASQTALRNIRRKEDNDYKGRTLKTNGLELINYSTRIAYKENGKLYINISKYSATTSKIQSKLRFIAKDFYMDNEIVEYEGK